jgi:hypothetical protein
LNELTQSTGINEEGLRPKQLGYLIDFQKNLKAEFFSYKNTNAQSFLTLSVC